jgi:4-amino-4-deoxy-L-arabinose transferase-like glycosyltransferase
MEQGNVYTVNAWDNGVKPYPTNNRNRLYARIGSALVEKLIGQGNDDSDNKTLIPIFLMSGIFLGLAIFTKIPTFTMIPVVGFLIFTNSNKKD